MREGPSVTTLLFCRTSPQTRALGPQTLVLAPPPSPPPLRTGDRRDGVSTAPYLTLRRLEVWLAEPIRRMRLLASMTDAMDGLTGGALAGAVYAHVHAHGDPFVRTYAAKVTSFAPRATLQTPSPLAHAHACVYAANVTSVAYVQ